MTGIDNDDIPRPAYTTEDLDEVAFRGRCVMIWWFRQARALLPMRFQYPDQVHEKAGMDLTAHVDAEARQMKNARVAVNGRASRESLRAVIMAEGRIATELRRGRLRRSAHAQLRATD